MNELNPQQRDAVNHIGTPLLVLAGAGSGKTGVITRKIAWLINHCGMPANSVAAVTFTNKAAREMRERAVKLLGKEQSRGLAVSTFHTLGLGMIRREYRRLGYKSGFSIFDSDDAKTLIRDLLIQHHGGGDDQVDLIQSRISNWKNELQSPEQVVAVATSPADMLCAQAYRHYQAALKAYNAVDFDDLIQLPVILLRDHDEVRERWRQRIRYLLVDEYQDTNGAQYELVRLLVGERNCLTVVGDDDQSIYSWRGARPENMAQLQKDYPSLRVVKLEQNYRSTGTILKAANAVIANNPHLFSKSLWSGLQQGDKIRVMRCPDEPAECEFIVNDILARKLTRGLRFGDFAVLYRGNHQSRLLELALQESGIPYNISGGTSFFARNEIKDVMAYLRQLINPDDDNAFLRIVNVPRRKIGTSTLTGLGSYASERGIGLSAACGELGLESHLPAAAVTRLREFTDWLQETRRRCFEGDPVAGIRQLLHDIDYREWLLANSSSESIADRRYANVDILIGSIERSVADDGENADIEEAINRLVLRDLLEQQDEQADADDRVQLMTLHAAKGLEFPQVYMMGVEERILPHHNSMDAEALEEERRLCYVGITRARENLTLSWCAKRKGYGELQSCDPSRFIDEIPADALTRIGETPDPEQNQQDASETLAALKGLF